MAFRRQLARATPLDGDELHAALVGIGIRLAGSAVPGPNIEDTLVAASVAGMERDDVRVLALLVTWLGVHGPWVQADRLVRLCLLQPSPRVRAFWSAIARWRSTDARLARLLRLHRGPRVDLLAVGTDFQVRRRGEDTRFAGGPLRVPAGVLRDRPRDVLSPAELAGVHAAYRARVAMGPSYRADMWATLDRAPAMRASDLARACYGSFATAWGVKRDYGILHAGGD